MLTLYLIRHAKSSWKKEGIKDFDRPLNKRGETSIDIMAQVMREKNWLPEKWVSSPAKRAWDTAMGISKRLGAENVQTEEALYLAPISIFLNVINQLGHFKSVALVGHNPGITEIVEYISQKQIDNMPTAGLAKIDFDFDSWEMVSQGTGYLSAFEYPRKHFDF